MDAYDHANKHGRADVDTYHDANNATADGYQYGHIYSHRDAYRDTDTYRMICRLTVGEIGL